MLVLFWSYWGFDWCNLRGTFFKSNIRNSCGINKSSIYNDFIHIRWGNCRNGKLKGFILIDTSLFTNLVINVQTNSRYFRIGDFYTLLNNYFLFKENFINFKNIVVGSFGVAFNCFTYQIIVAICRYKFKFQRQWTSLWCELGIQMPPFVKYSFQNEIKFGFRNFLCFRSPFYRIKHLCTCIGKSQKSQKHNYNFMIHHLNPIFPVFVIVVFHYKSAICNLFIVELSILKRSSCRIPTTQTI